MLSTFQSQVPQPFSTDDAFEALIHSSCEFLANGTSRAVYVVRGADLIVKVALDQSKVVCNWIEVTAFLSFQSDQQKLAKIISWSKSGKFIVMEKLDTRVDPGSCFMAPAWVTDIGAKNGGTDAYGNYKLCDYAFVKSPDESYQTPFV